METIYLILQLLSVVIGLYLASFKSYFSEKGKNLATQQDIEEITQKIETVKTEFQILVHSKTSLNTEKRNSYLNYYDKYFIWLNILLDSSLGGFDNYNEDEIEKYRIKIDSIYLDLLNAESRMLLWNENQDLVDLVFSLKYNTLENFQIPCKSCLGELKFYNQELHILSIENVELQESKTELIHKYCKIQSDFSDKLTQQYEILIVEIREFIKQSRQYLIDFS